jgi:outer membrane lipoprotein SlyB
VESAAKNGEWGCLAGTAAGAVAGAVVGSFFAKGLGGGNVARTLTGAGGAVGGGALGQKLACK